MTSVFTKIINGELPGLFVYSDDEVVAFLTIAPLRPGHTLVVPRREVANWLELSESELQALWAACRLEVPPVPFHLVPIDSEAEVRFDRADSDPDPAVLDDAQQRIRAALEIAAG